MCLLLCLTLLVQSTQVFAADDNINNGMGYTVDGTIAYEDDFASAKIEDNKLIIYTTDCSNENKSKYLQWAGEYSDAIEFKETEYSYNNLLEKGQDVLDVLYESIGQTELNYYVSEANNSIVVLMDKETKNNLERQRYAISFDVPVTYEVNNNYSLSSTDVIGGSALLNATTLQSMSVGCCGYFRGVRSIATCGHGSSGDYAVISDTSSNSNFNFTNKIGATYKVTGMITSPVVNTYVYFYGSATKTYCLGQVTVVELCLR